MFGNMSDSNCSLDGMRNFLSEETIDISAQGLDFRFTEVAVKFMQSMYEQCLKLFRNTMTLDCNILQQFNSVKLLDSSHVILPAN
ncbi:MAG: IS4 family transposase, partial [Rickettsia endosymbiont of Ixodes persulcatus]|nr:IS4 family transposase [Rickettsia endosymbiont of Ixodes persulcatus]